MIRRKHNTPTPPKKSSPNRCGGAESGHVPVDPETKRSLKTQKLVFHPEDLGCGFDPPQSGLSIVGALNVEEKQTDRRRNGSRHGTTWNELEQGNSGAKGAM